MRSDTKRAIKKGLRDAFLTVAFVVAVVGCLLYFFGALSTAPRTEAERLAKVQTTSHEEPQPGTWSVMYVKDDIPGFKRIVLRRVMPEEKPEQSAYLAGLGDKWEECYPGEIVDVAHGGFVMNEQGRYEHFLAVRKKKTTAIDIGR